MNLIDVTLRDGGHQVDFNWPNKFLSKYFPAISGVQQLDFVELGYWSQTEKSLNRFYNMTPNVLEELVELGLSSKASVMIDYHYCSHHMSSYRSDVFEQNVDLVRLCSRREDISEAVKFGRQLIDELGVKLSLNFFNITNYSKQEIEYCIEKGKEAGATFLYFADTHGALNLFKERNVYEEYANIINDNEMIAGLHLHDHSGKAYLNFCIGQEIGFGSFDCSLGGMGKGVGNLRMEHVVDPILNASIIDMLSEEQILRMQPLIPGLVTAALSATDYYAVWAEKLDIKPSDLIKLLLDKSPSERDIFDKHNLLGSERSSKN